MVCRCSLLFVVRFRVSVYLSWLLVVVLCEISQLALVVVIVDAVVVVVMADMVVEMVAVVVVVIHFLFYVASWACLIFMLQLEGGCCSRNMSSISSRISFYLNFFNFTFLLQVEQCVLS